MPEPLDHDRLFKELLTTFFWDFVELFLPEVAGYARKESIVFIDKEIFADLPVGERFEVDLLAKMTFKDREACFLIHGENQSTPQAEFHRRMFHYFAVLDRKLGLPVYPVAIFSFDQPQRAEQDEYTVGFPDRVVMAFKFRAIQLNRLNWRDYLRSPNPIASALMAKMKIEAKDRPKVKLECLRMLATLKLDRERARLISGFVDAYLKLSAEEMKEFMREVEVIHPQPLREGVMELTTSWKEEGIEIGLKKGREEGRQLALRTTILRQLAHRFGPLEEEIQHQVENLSIERSEQLSEALLDFNSSAELSTWLRLNQS